MTMSSNCGWVLQTAGEGQVRLKGPVGDRRRCKLAAGDLQVLGTNCGQHIARRHSQVRNPIRIEPQPHRIIARAENLDVANAVQSQQLVADLQQRIVADVELVERVVRRQHEHDHQQIRTVLFRDDALPLHLHRQLRQRDGDAVLDQHLGLVEIGAELERDGDVELAVRGRPGCRDTACPRRR